MQQAQVNTIIKLLVKFCTKLEDIDNRLIKLESGIQILRKGKETVSNLELNNSLDYLDKESNILTNRVEKL